MGATIPWHPALSLEGNELCIEAELCINLRGRSELCNRCTDACPSDALNLSIDEVSVNRDLCQNCGACVSHCPTTALKLSGFSPVRFVEAAAASESPHLHCRESRNGGGGVIIPCFFTLNAELIAAALGRGASVWSLHGLDRCEKCLRGDARQHTQTMIEQLSDWFGDAAPQLNLTPDTQAEGERLAEHQTRISRRNFLRLTGTHGVENAAKWILPTDPEPDPLDELPFYQHEGFTQSPRPSLALLASEANKLPWSQSANLPWRKHQVSDECSACLSCGKRCPTGALISIEQRGIAALGFQQDLCSDCGLCEAICPTSAIHIDALSSVAELTNQHQVVMRRQQQPCRSCGHPFIPVSASVTQCPTCEKEQSLDDDWMSMLGE